MIVTFWLCTSCVLCVFFSFFLLAHETDCIRTSTKTTSTLFTLPCFRSIFSIPYLFHSLPSFFRLFWLLGTFSPSFHIQNDYWLAFLIPRSHNTTFLALRQLNSVLSRWHNAVFLVWRQIHSRWLRQDVSWLSIPLNSVSTLHNFHDFQTT